MDAEPSLLGALPRLFQDLEDLGARAGDVIALLVGAEAEFEPKATALDLGCGKGAVAIELARRLGLHVQGVDGMPEFVRHAAERADTEGVSQRCRFSVADLRDVVGSYQGFDLVTLLAMGPIFGDAAHTIGVLRRCTRAGGLMIIDDAYLVDPSAELDLEHCYDHSTTIRMLESHGDRVIAERTMDTPENETWLRAMTAKICQRAYEVASQQPALAPQLLEFAERQRQETEVLCGPVVGALWLLRRA